jgi:excisionase family DNA binding protein
MKKKQEFLKLLTLRQAAEILNVHIETLRRWDKSGRLKAVRIGGRKDRRYKIEDINRLLKK